MLRSSYAYIDVVRDPVDRIASFFYFRRAKSMWQGKEERPPQVKGKTLIAHFYMQALGTERGQIEFS